MANERAILAGGCFWGMQDLIRKRPGIVSTLVGYTGGEVPNATYSNHGNHAEGIETPFISLVMDFVKLVINIIIHTKICLKNVQKSISLLLFIHINL